MDGVSLPQNRKGKRLEEIKIPKADQELELSQESSVVELGEEW